VRKKKKSDKYTTLILILILLAGVSLLLYPGISQQWNARHHGQLISDYQQTVGEMDTEKYAGELAAAREYNQRLLLRSDPYRLPPELAEDYAGVLDVDGSGVMGYLEIPSIDCALAVYHGIDEAVLQTNVGHIEWSSLPVGGGSTHSVLSGHRGLPSAELLTNIDRMEIGDVFYIHILGEKLSYVVDDISVVLPHETEKLQIFEGKDYVTLLTCTPYGINSHRLLVRGERVNAESGGGTELYIPNEVVEMGRTLPVAVGMLSLALCGGLAAAAVGIIRKNRREDGEK